jgi:hypothetical protein
MNREESRANSFANIRSFEGSVERTIGTVGERSDEFRRAVEGGVLDEQVGQEVEAAGLEIGGIVDGRSGRHEKFDGIRGVAEDEASESSRR